jgi:hypothetical protein
MGFWPTPPTLKVSYSSYFQRNSKVRLFWFHSLSHLLTILVITAIHEGCHKVFSLFNSSSSLLALQLCVGFCLLHGPFYSVGFVTVNFSRVGFLAPRPTSKLEVQGLYFVWPLFFDLSGIGDTTRSWRSRQHNFSGLLGRANLLSTTRR